MNKIRTLSNARYWTRKLSFLPDPPFSPQQEKLEHLKAAGAGIFFLALILGMIFFS